MLKKIRLLLIGIICVIAAAAAMANRGKASLEPSVVAAQDVTYLSGRISSLEQRLYSLESTINQLRQQVTVARPSVVTPNTRDPEVERKRGRMRGGEAR
jgi:uncharacterized protein YlxW (UPF0749 family)